MTGHRSLSLRTIRKQRFPTLERYWNDADYRKRMDEEAAHQQAIMNAEWDARLEKRNRND